MLVQLVLGFLIFLSIGACDSRDAGPLYAAWRVEIVDPASGVVHVHGEIPVMVGTTTLALQFRDLKRHPQALLALTARSGGRELVVDHITEDADATHRIDVTGIVDPVVIEYTINPTFFPPGGSEKYPSDARSRVVDGVGVVRTGSLLPTMTDGNRNARVSFSLPADWVAVTPWRSVDTGVFTIPASEWGQVDYLGLGPFETLELPVGKDIVRIGVLGVDSEIDVDAVAGLLEFHRELAGSPPVDPGPRTVLLVPQKFMRGGAAGARSTVQIADAGVLAHELLHWWVHSDLTTAEAKWFTEGFTNYYGILAAQEVGLLSQDEVTECFADLNAEMRYLERDRPRSLQQVSEGYTREARSRRLVYSKGTLFAELLERELRLQDRALSEFMRAVLTESRAGLNNKDLRETLANVYGNLADARFIANVIAGEALPDMGFGPATGRSGCARYLPEHGDQPFEREREP